MPKYIFPKKRQEPFKHMNQIKTRVKNLWDYAWDKNEAQIAFYMKGTASQDFHEVLQLSDASEK